MGGVFIRKTTCPWCGRVNELNSGAGGNKHETPSVGAVGLCFTCRQPAIFTETLDLRKPTEAEMAEIKKDPTVGQYLRAMQTGLDPVQAARLGDFLADQ
jgi:hypothetical protein